MDVDALRRALEAVAEPDRVEPMTAYMRRRFEFLGVRSARLREAARPLVAAAARTPGDALVAFADECWLEHEREFQYVGTLLLRRGVRNLETRHIDDLRRFVSTKSWWDTVDSLATWSVGPLVRADADLSEVMDRWIHDVDPWVARTAILHQLSFKDDTDADRLFRYALLRADDTDFFIRKAIGWALRQYARQDPEAVRAFVEANRNRLSGLTVREAVKHLDR